MATIIKEIEVDVSQLNRFAAIVAKQYDKQSRFLKVTLLDSGERIKVESASTAVINARREDEVAKTFEGTVNADGTVTVPLTYWMLQLDGTVKCDISIITANKTVLSTTLFELEVQEAAAPDDSEIEKDDDYGILIQLIAGVQAIKDAEAKRVNAETTRVNAEAARVKAEQARVSAENSRVDVETKRVTAEKGRVDVESKRVAAETSRVQAETKRATDENARKEAEEQRAQETQIAIINANKATEAAKKASENIQKQVTELKKAKISYKVIKKISADTKIACTAITINTTELSFAQLEEIKQLTTTVTPPNTTDTISWESSNVDVATVTNSGVVESVGYGVAEIIAKCGTQSASCNINVKKAEVEVTSDKVVIPDSHNTGVENDIQLKEINSSSLSGTRLQMTQQNANTYCNSNGIIEGYHFNGLYVDFNKSITQTVTFKNCKFTGDDNIAYAVAVSTYGVDKGISFENCEFSHYKAAVASGLWKAVFDKCYVHDMMQDAFKINHSEIYLRNCYVRSLGLSPTSHADGVQIENNTVDVTAHIYNCRFDQPFTSENTENSAIFAKCNDNNIILDVQKCHVTGGNYTIYALDGSTAKVTGKIESTVGCSCRYGTTNISDNVEQDVTVADKLMVGTVGNGKVYAANYTNSERTLRIVTDAGEKTSVIPKCPTYAENHTQAFSEYPFDLAIDYPAGATWVQCYENDNLIRTQKLGG